MSLSAQAALISRLLPAVADYLNAPRDAIMVGMSFVDRLVAAWPVITERNYKLLVVASFFLSMKILHRNKLQIDFLCRLSSFSKKDIFSMESTILSHLEWKVHPPCATEFLRLYIENLDLPRAKLQAIEADATFYIEQSLFDSFFIPFCASQIAMAAFLNASLKRLTEAEASKVATLFDAGVEVYSCRVQLTKIMVQNQPSRDWDRKSPVSTASLDEEKKKWG